jgi:hypothetical protein
MQQRTCHTVAAAITASRLQHGCGSVQSSVLLDVAASRTRGVKSRALQWCGFIVVLSAGGCATGMTDPDASKTPCATAKELRSAIPGGAAGFLTRGQEAAIAARVIPGGFGGLFEDLNSRTLVARLKDMSQRQAAQDVLTQVLTCGAVYPGWLNVFVSIDVIEFRQGQYDGIELLSHFEALADFRTDPDVWGMELDPELNRIWVGIDDPGALSRIQARVSAVSVPLGAVAIEAPPPSTGAGFEVLEPAVLVQENPQVTGIFSFNVHLRYTNQFQGTRYPDQCVSPDLSVFYSYFLFTVARWDGTQWVPSIIPICRAILLQPRPVAPGQQQTDSIPIVVSRRLSAGPFWHAARLTGYYRFEVPVYLSTTSTPPFVTGLAPLEQRVSAPFRVIVPGGSASGATHQ